MIEKIEADLKSAMLDANKQTVSTLRLLKSALKNKSIELKRELNDKDVMAVLRSEAKKRRESIEMYTTGSKPDLAAKEQAELELIESYLPAQLSDEELAQMIATIQTELGEKAHKGQLIQTVIQRAEGRADGRRISEYINKL